MTFCALWSTITLLWIALAQQSPSLEQIHATRCFPAKKPACYLSRNCVGRPQLADCSGFFLIVLPTKACEHTKVHRANFSWLACCFSLKRVNCVISHCKIHFVQRWNVALSSVGPASELTEAWTIAKSKGENPSKALISAMIPSNRCLPDRPVFQST